MFGSPTLEVILGLILMFVILSWCCLVLNEIMELTLGYRATHLKRGIYSLFQSPDLVEKFYEHPLIRAHGYRGRRPQYIPSRSFALAIIDIVSATGRMIQSPNNSAIAYNTSDLRLMQHVLVNMPDETLGGVKSVFLILLAESRNDVDRFRRGVELWFDEAMEQVSGAYKRHALTSLFVISTIVAFAINADTIGMTWNLYRGLAPNAAQIAASRILSPSNPTGDTYSQIKDTLQQISEPPPFPLGWSARSWTVDVRGIPDSPTGFVQKIIGILLTSLIVTLGASFWFDLLNKFVNVRSAYKPRELALLYELQPPFAAPPESTNGSNEYESKYTA
jgi:hypothetical protein